MKTKKSILCLFIAAVVAIAAVSCQKEDAIIPLVPSDIIPEPGDSENENYLLWGDDTMLVHHCMIDRPSQGGIVITVFLCNQPKMQLLILLNDEKPSHRQQLAQVGIDDPHAGVVMEHASILFDTVNYGYKLEANTYYAGKPLVLHFEGPFTDPDKPAGHGVYRRNGLESDICFNRCHKYQDKYWLAFSSHQTPNQQDYFYFGITLSEPIAPGKYTGNQVSFTRCIENSDYFYDNSSDCTLNISRHNNTWQLQVTCTLDSTELSFDYTGTLNFLYVD